MLENTYVLVFSRFKKLHAGRHTISPHLSLYTTECHTKHHSAPECPRWKFCFALRDSFTVQKAARQVSAPSRVQSAV